MGHAFCQVCSAVFYIFHKNGKHSISYLLHDAKIQGNGDMDSKLHRSGTKQLSAAGSVSLKASPHKEHLTALCGDVLEKQEHRDKGDCVSQNMRNGADNAITRLIADHGKEQAVKKYSSNIINDKP